MLPRAARFLARAAQRSWSPSDTYRLPTFAVVEVEPAALGYLLVIRAAECAQLAAPSSASYRASARPAVRLCRSGIPSCKPLGTGGRSWSNSTGCATRQRQGLRVASRRRSRIWYQGVQTSCGNLTWPATGAPLAMAGGYIWYGYNGTCHQDPVTDEYCNDVVDAFTLTETLDEMLDAELCSACFVDRVRMMQASAYSIYNTVSWYQTALEAINARCSSVPTMPTATRPPLIALPTAGDFCVSGNCYTTLSGDTCNSIALATNVSSAGVFYAASPALSNCTNLPVGLTFCLPPTCNPYLLAADDDCYSASVSASVPDIKLYNPWIDASCDNLHEANTTLGSVVCAGPLGGTPHLPGTPTNTSGIPGGGSANYSSVIVPPPTGATVDDRTTLDCGHWYVADADASCAFVTSASMAASAATKCH